MQAARQFIAEKTGQSTAKGRKLGVNVRRQLEPNVCRGAQGCIRHREMMMRLLGRAGNNLIGAQGNIAGV